MKVPFEVDSSERSMRKGKRSRLRLLFLLCSILTIAALFAGCSGGGGAESPLNIPTSPPEAAPPSPPTELPSFLSLVSPSQLKVDLAAISPPITNVNASVKNVIFGPGDPILQYIQSGPETYARFFSAFEAALAGIEELEIPVSTETTTFEAAHTFSAEAGILAGPHNVKMDFAFDHDDHPFDMDNDGVPEACSGNTVIDAEHAICLRMWVDIVPGGPLEPFLAGVILQYPQNLASDGKQVLAVGRGWFKVRVASYEALDIFGQPGDTVKQSLIAQYIYDQDPAAPDMKRVAFQTMFNCNPDKLCTTNMLLGQNGPDATAFKGLNASLDFGPMDSVPVCFKYIGQYVEGGGYWSGRLIQGDLPPAVPDFMAWIAPPYDCATLPDGIIRADRNECAHVPPPDGLYNLLTDAIPFLEYVTGADFAPGTPLAFPLDFPPRPTF
jgi:hypothetical protein